jgi:hypothetical protein
LTIKAEGELITSVPFGAKIDHFWNMECDRYPPQSEGTIYRKKIKRKLKIL